MEFDFFIGIDVSKNELDFAVQQGKCFLFHREIANEPEAIKLFVKELSKLPGFSLTRAIFCMEHTGIYNNHLLSCLHQKKTNICLESAIHIKKSLGNIRGKNDKIDAIRIAGYAYEKREKLRLWAPKRDVVLQLAHLAATRTRLVEARKMLKAPLKEHDIFSPKKVTRQNTSLCAGTFRAIDTDLKKTEKAIDQLIASDPELKRLFSLTTSVTGIGKVTAAQIIITSNEFKTIDDPKQYASYSGVAPFTEESGIFKGKGRVSQMANKKVKTLLHMSALVAIQYNAELKVYYQRKVSGDKKNKMSVINAVRNKLILRVFACVNQNKHYEINYQKILV
jgi:transposase